MKKLPAKFHAFVMPFFLTMIMTAIVSAISTLRVVGFHGSFPVWVGSWLWSWLVAYPTVLIVLPIAKKLSSALVSPNE